PTNGAFVEFGLAFGAFPLDVVIGSDGNLWVTEAGRSKIARFKPASGVVAEFQPPAQSGVPQRIVSAPDGTLWFTEADGMDVGRVTVNGSFQTIATPGLENFDITVTANNVVYFTGRDIATQQDTLRMLTPAPPNNRRRSAKH
ncbi:MAG TPA: hypothetical protein VJ853_02470, partial [Thermoanaerobaculia bacterium]|nr:hypothetical protein [Thermoanaerobaculia bacterium]